MFSPHDLRSRRERSYETPVLCPQSSFYNSLHNFQKCFRECHSSSATPSQYSGIEFTSFPPENQTRRMSVIFATFVRGLQSCHLLIISFASMYSSITEIHGIKFCPYQACRLLPFIQLKPSYTHALESALSQVTYIPSHSKTASENVLFIKDSGSYFMRISSLDRSSKSCRLFHLYHGLKRNQNFQLACSCPEKRNTRNHGPFRNYTSPIYKLGVPLLPQCWDVREESLNVYF